VHEHERTPRQLPREERDASVEWIVALELSRAPPNDALYAPLSTRARAND
jgi:hypothetical protein